MDLEAQNAGKNAFMVKVALSQSSKYTLVFRIWTISELAGGIQAFFPAFEADLIRSFIVSDLQIRSLISRRTPGPRPLSIRSRPAARMSIRCDPTNSTVWRDLIFLPT
jgi:hypothetical protein